MVDCRILGRWASTTAGTDLVLDALGSCMRMLSAAARPPRMEVLEDILTKARCGMVALRDDPQGAMSASPTSRRPVSSSAFFRLPAARWLAPSSTQRRSRVWEGRKDSSSGRWISNIDEIR